MIMMTFMSLCEINNGSKIILCYPIVKRTLWRSDSPKQADSVFIVVLICTDIKWPSKLSVSCQVLRRGWRDRLREETKFYRFFHCKLGKDFRGKDKNCRSCLLLTKLIFVLFMYSWNYKRTLRLGYGIGSPNLCNTKQEWCLFTNNDGTDVQSTWSTFKISWL